MIHDDAGRRLLANLVEHFDGMVYRCRNDPFWTIEYASSGCRRLTGYLPIELVDNRRVSYEELILPQDRAGVRERIEQAIDRRERFDAEYRLRHADGDIRWVWEYGYGVFDGDGRLHAIEGFIQDITDRKRNEQALIEAESRFRDLFDNAAEGIFQTTVDGRYLRANPSLARIYGFDSPQDLMAEFNVLRDRLYVDANVREAFIAVLERENHVRGFEAQVRRRDGKIIWVSENARAVRDAEGRLQYFEGTVEDITERKAYEAQIAHQALHDPLTGLPNRALLRDRLQRAVQIARRSGERLAVVFLDLDHFKDVNDTLGHVSGDELIRRMAERMVACVRHSDTVARIGGDEFVVLSSDAADSDAIAALTHRILNRVVAPLRLEDRELTVTGSLGVAIYPDHGGDADTLLKHADAAMYEAKRAGRNAFRLFTPELTANVARRLDLVGRLRQALARNEFLLLFQPKVSAASGQWVGLEALLRWQSSDGSIIAPSDFVPAAEESGLIVPLGDWVLRSACHAGMRVAQAADRPISVSVNVSPRQFHNTDLCASVEQALRLSGLPAAALDLEITENCSADDPRGFLDTLERLKRLGVSLSIDDFGTGYSNMSYLKAMPIDRLKIDRSFIEELGRDPANQTILRAIVSLGHTLGLKVLAEGVETSAQHMFVRALGCDEVQGYLFGRPAPLANVLAAVTAGVHARAANSVATEAGFQPARPVEAGGI